MEFKNCDSNTDKVKLYESVRKRPAEIYTVLNDVNKIDLREYQLKVKTEEEQIKNGYSQ